MTTTKDQFWEHLEFNEMVLYFNSKKVPFLVKTDYVSGKSKIMGINISKKGKFFRANGKIIGGNIAKYFLTEFQNTLRT